MDTKELDSLVYVDPTLPDSIFDKACTKTTLFLLYMLGMSPFKMFPYLVNAYVDDKEFIHDYTCPIFILFRTQISVAHRDMSWSLFEASIRNLPTFRHRYYAGKQENNDLVMYVFEVPELLREDYKKFLDGRYSEFSATFKSLIPEVQDIRGVRQAVLHHRIVHKEPKLKAQMEQILGVHLDDKAELWSAPDITGRETYRS